MNVVKILVCHGASINQLDRWGSTPLREAVRVGHDKVSAFLKTNGGSLMFEPFTAAVELCTLAVKGHTEKVQALVNAGADVNATTWDGRAALHVAANWGHKATVQTLVDLGAEVGLTDRMGNTAKADAERAGVLDLWGSEIWEARGTLSGLGRLLGFALPKEPDTKQEQNPSENQSAVAIKNGHKDWHSMEA
uniref:Uncharacterized protein n=1 Tax=Haptolina brevifila TaxID=156173 RepID=A0A7S2NJ88_9EUKA